MKNLTVLILVVFFCMNTSLAYADLQALAGCQRGRIVIINNDSEHWFDVKIEVNRIYIHETAVIPKGETMRFFPNIFKKKDGTRLNLLSIACKTIDIHATVKNDRNHWNGSYE